LAGHFVSGGFAHAAVFGNLCQLGQAWITDKAGAETLNLVATGRADAAGEYEYVINSAIKDRGLPLKAVGDVLAVVPTYFLSKRTDDMKQVNEKIDKTMKEMRADGTLKKLSEQYLGGDYTFDPTQK